jgi:hypothetical protein
MSSELTISSAESPAVNLTLEQIKELEARLVELVAVGDALYETLKALAGPEPGALGEELRYRLHTGTGQHRAAKDTLNAMLRQHARIKKQLTCPHDGGLRYQGHDAFCKLCGWPFFRKDRDNWQPVERMIP